MALDDAEGKWLDKDKSILGEEEWAEIKQMKDNLLRLQS